MLTPAPPIRSVKVFIQPQNQAETHSYSRNNGWAAARASLITADHRTLVAPTPVHPWSGHWCNSPWESRHEPLCPTVAHLLTPAAASAERSSSSPQTPSIHINFKQVEPISSSLPTVSASGKHPIHIIRAAPHFMPRSWGSSALKDTRMGVNWLCDDYYGLIMAGGWKTSRDHLQTDGYSRSQEITFIHCEQEHSSTIGGEPRSRFTLFHSQIKKNLLLGLQLQHMRARTCPVHFNSIYSSLTHQLCSLKRQNKWFCETF